MGGSTSGATRAAFAIPGAWTKDSDVGDTGGTRCDARALALAQKAPRGEPAGRCRDPLARRRGARRGLAPRRRNPHAEIDALSKLAPVRRTGATAVVTLEPCNHHRPHRALLRGALAAGVARVVYAVADPAMQLRRRGERLRAAGVDVESGPARRGDALLASWLTVQRSAARTSP
jgi:diaminohydroxyphosphoribosylaminopyrimidine deaminase/5-amino-6-(5-phosphoribosylamino)uracil reductase